MADLVAFGQVWIEVVFSIEDRAFAYLSADAKTKFDGVVHSLFVKYRQHAGHCQINGTGLGVGFGAEGGGRAGKYFRFGGQLQVYFETDNGFPLHQSVPPFAESGVRKCQSVAC